MLQYELRQTVLSPRVTESSPVGGRAPEQLVPTPGGAKSGRRPDIIYETPDGTRRGVNVGQTTADGSPVPREQSALDDLNGPGGLPTDFVPYD